MNINRNNQKKQHVFPMFESENFNSEQFQDSKQEMKNQDKIETVFSVKSKQFEFESGVLMAGMSIDTEIKFGLKWHAKNTRNSQEFITSISEFVTTINMKLTEKDISKLLTEYSKYEKLTNG